MFLKKVNFDFGKLPKELYLKQLPFYNTKELKFRKNIVFITGDNGAGKTTLIEGLAYGFNLNKYGGSKNFIFNVNEKPKISNFMNITKSISTPKDAFFFRSDTFFNLENELNKYELNEHSNELKRQYSGEKSFKDQSHGEGFITFFKNRIRKNGLYFFDEPETALSFDNQILFLFLLKQFENDDNQIFIITHSPVLLSYPNAQIINLSNNGIDELDYEETEQFVNLKKFLNNYKSYQKEINDFK